MRTLQNLRVKDAYKHDLPSTLIVGADEDFTEVIRRFAHRPESPGIFVADAEGRLLGVITRTDLLEWARLRVGAFLQIQSPLVDRTFRVASLMQATTAGEAMHPESRRAAVREEESLAQALRIMIELDLIVLPVVDEDHKIVEDLKLDEILARIVEIES